MAIDLEKLVAETGLAKLHIIDKHGKEWRVLDLARPEIERTLQAIADATRQQILERFDRADMCYAALDREKVLDAIRALKGTMP